MLAVFDDVEVDSGLYYLVFGEALLNDGITYVMFEGFKSLGNPINPNYMGRGLYSYSYSFFIYFFTQNLFPRPNP